MRLRLMTRAAAAVAVGSAVALSAAGQGLAPQQPGRGNGTSPPERASGVIVKVERVAQGVTPSPQSPTIPGSTVGAGLVRPWTYRLTINTNAVWRDWARDQAAANDAGPPRKDAAKGDESVATKGEPAGRNSLVVVDVGPETRVETRFRSADEEADKGKNTPDAARSSDRGAGRSLSAKPVQFRADDLQPGLFVEVDFHHLPAQNPASSVSVIRPIGGPNTPAAKAAPEGSR
jgi:hypothetical protein